MCVLLLTHMCFIFPHISRYFYIFQNESQGKNGKEVLQNQLGLYFKYAHNPTSSAIFIEQLQILNCNVKN